MDRGHLALDPRNHVIDLHHLAFDVHRPALDPGHPMCHHGWRTSGKQHAAVGEGASAAGREARYQVATHAKSLPGASPGLGPCPCCSFGQATCPARPRHRAASSSIQIGRAAPLLDPYGHAALVMEREREAQESG